MTEHANHDEMHGHGGQHTKHSRPYLMFWINMALWPAGDVRRHVFHDRWTG